MNFFNPTSQTTLWTPGLLEVGVLVRLPGKPLPAEVVKPLPMEDRGDLPQGGLNLWAG